MGFFSDILGVQLFLSGFNGLIDLVYEADVVFVLTQFSLSQVVLPSAATQVSTSSTAPPSLPATTAMTTVPLSSNCTTITISLLSNSFSPANVSVRAGDLLAFEWVTGFHYVVDTTNNTDPASCDDAAAAWSSGTPVGRAGTVFRVSTGGLAPGVYRFACPIHCGSMKGSFQVAVKEKEKNRNVLLKKIRALAIVRRYHLT